MLRQERKKELTLNRKLPLSSAAFCAYSQMGRRRPTADAGLLAIVSLLSTDTNQSTDHSVNQSAHTYTAHIAPYATKNQRY